MAANVVCQGAMCTCNQGTAPTPLTVTSQMIVSNSGMTVATIMDFAPMTNVTPFANCLILTQAAQGVPTPCVPAPVGPWAPGSLIDKINGFPVLTANSKLVCGIGGEISITSPNCLPDVETQ